MILFFGCGDFEVGQNINKGIWIEDVENLFLKIDRIKSIGWLERKLGKSVWSSKNESQ